MRSLLLEDLKDTIPSNVFPISLDVCCDRTTKKDEVIQIKGGDGWENFDRPYKTFPLLMSEKMPYIPRSPVYFRNPILRPNLGPTAERLNSPFEYDGMVGFEDFSDDLTDAVGVIEDVHPPSVDRIYLTNMVLTVIPEEYAIEKNGNRGWTRELWEDNVRIPIAEFTKESKIPPSVKKQMEEESPGILAGKTIMPLDLEKITSVVTKMALKPRSEVKRMYWTKKQAKRARENAERAREDPPDYFPREHGIEAISNWSKDRIRHELEGLEDLLMIVDYTGETERREDFTPENVEITSL